MKNGGKNRSVAFIILFSVCFFLLHVGIRLSFILLKKFNILFYLSHLILLRKGDFLLSTGEKEDKKSFRLILKDKPEPYI